MKKSRFSRKYTALLRALRDARLKAGLTQKEVGRKFGAHASFVSKCESGERRIDVIEFASFCKLYGVTVNELLAQVGIE